MRSRRIRRNAIPIEKNTVISCSDVANILDLLNDFVEASGWDAPNFPIDFKTLYRLYDASKLCSVHSSKSFENTVIQWIVDYYPDEFTIAEAKRDPTVSNRELMDVLGVATEMRKMKFEPTVDELQRKVEDVEERTRRGEKVPTWELEELQWDLEKIDSQVEAPWLKRKKKHHAPRKTRKR